MLARVKIVIDTYLENAKALESKPLGGLSSVSVFGKKIDVTYNRKTAGIKRASEYWENISKNFTPFEDMSADDIKALDKRLVEKVYLDVILADKGELGTSTDLRSDLIYALFDKLGLNELQVETELELLNRENLKYAVTAGAAGVGNYAQPRAADVLDASILLKLKLLMRHQHYSVTADNSNVKEMQMRM